MNNSAAILVGVILAFLTLVVICITYALGAFGYIGKQCGKCAHYKKCWGTTHADAFGESPACKYFKEKD